MHLIKQKSKTPINTITVIFFIILISFFSTLSAKEICGKYHNQYINYDRAMIALSRAWDILDSMNGQCYDSNWRTCDRAYSELKKAVAIYTTLFNSARGSSCIRCSLRDVLVIARGIDRVSDTFVRRGDNSLRGARYSHVVESYMNDSWCKYPTPKSSIQIKHSNPEDIPNFNGLIGNKPSKTSLKPGQSRPTWGTLRSLRDFYGAGGTHCVSDSYIATYTSKGGHVSESKGRCKGICPKGKHWSKSKDLCY